MLWLKCTVWSSLSKYENLTPKGAWLKYCVSSSILHNTSTLSHASKYHTLHRINHYTKRRQYVRTKRMSARHFQIRSSNFQGFNDGRTAKVYRKVTPAQHASFLSYAKSFEYAVNTTDDVQQEFDRFYATVWDLLDPLIVSTLSGLLLLHRLTHQSSSHQLLKLCFGGRTDWCAVDVLMKPMFWLVELVERSLGIIA